MQRMDRTKSEVGATKKGALRPVEAIYRQPMPHWVGDGFRVSGYFNAIPDAARRLSPFILLDYSPPYEFPPTHEKRGVGPHPHRGFETVTWAFQGSVAHRDSAGGGGVIRPGDAQWMTAASGVLHDEYHEAEWARRGGAFQMMQLWVNLPRANKMDPPRYQAIEARDMGLVELPAGSVRILAGEYQGVRGPARTFTPISIFDLELRGGGSASFEVPASHNLAALIMKGAVNLSGERASTNEFVVFQNEGELLEIAAAEDSRLVLLSGEPIDEPVVHHGPFVMNTEGEIRQAMIDFHTGKFGRLDG